MSEWDHQVLRTEQFQSGAARKEDGLHRASGPGSLSGSGRGTAPEVESEQPGASHCS